MAPLRNGRERDLPTTVDVIESMAIDPICGMTVDEKTALSTESDGEVYYFCCQNCQAEFARRNVRRRQPTSSSWGSRPGRGRLASVNRQGAVSLRVIRAAASPGMLIVQMGAAFAASETDIGLPYYCPMCEGVESSVPGSCPKCGMALERRDVRGREDDSELNDMTRRLVWAAVLGLPVFILAMGPMMGLPIARWLSPQDVRVAAIRVDGPRRLLGGMAVLSAGLAIDRYPTVQHVYADRDWDHRIVRLQRLWIADTSVLPSSDAQRRHGPHLL